MTVGCVLLVVMALDWFARAQVDAWSQIKNEGKPATSELPIEVVGRQFEWRFRYPSSSRLENDPELVSTFAKEAQSEGQADDVHVVNELHVWKGAQVEVHVKSADVLHSFFLPQLRLKQDAIPGRVSPIQLVVPEANTEWDPHTSDWKDTGELTIVCAELCGSGHYTMRGKVYVHKTKKDFLRWLRQAEER